MKKLILLLALTLAFVMCGCMEQKADDSYRIGTFKVIVLDSCEYIVEGSKLAHKGNCKYCAERRRKEQEELFRRLSKK